MSKTLFAFNMRVVSDKTVWIEGYTVADARRYLSPRGADGPDYVECSDETIVAVTYRRRPHEDEPISPPPPTQDGK